MAKIDKNAIEKSRFLKLIQQFGRGLEGVDIEAATRKGIWVSPIPSDDCGNAASVAEHAIYLSLALLGIKRKWSFLSNMVVWECPQVKHYWVLLHLFMAMEELAVI